MSHFTLSKTSTRIFLAVSAALAGPVLLTPIAEAKLSCGDCKKLERKARAEAKRFDRNVTQPLAHGVEREVRNGAANFAEAVRETGYYVDRQQRLVREVGQDSLHGNLLTAGYRFQRDFINGTSDNTARAMQESSALRMGAQIALSTYGGSAASGAFTTWYVREATGSGSAAVKAGLISYGTSVLTRNVSSAPAAAANVHEKALASAMIGGLGTAAQGGHFEKGFAQGAMMSYADSYVRSTTGEAPRGAVATKGPIDKPLNPDGTPAYDRAFVMSNADHAQMGMATDALPPNPTFGDLAKHYLAGERNPLFVAVTRGAPGAQGASLFHDVLTHDWNTVATVSSIPPAFIVHTYALGWKREDELMKAALGPRG